MEVCELELRMEREGVVKRRRCRVESSSCADEDEDGS